jgi:methionyl-tRNA synthetase
MSKFFVTTPIYYVNAKPHIGHIYTNIAADVLARFHRGQGDKVLFSTGTDENSQKNVEAAQKQGKHVGEYVDEMAAVWQETFKKLEFTPDVFIRTTAPEHASAVKALLEAIWAKGDIYLGDYIGYYCVACEAFVTEKELVDGTCPIHHTIPQEIKEKNYFFNLSKYRDQLLKYYQEHEDFVQPQSIRNNMLDYIANEMADISISRQSQEWGIRLPQDPEHAVYVWFDALINYLTVTGYPQDSYKEFWPADLHIIGKDIAKFHCAIWPAMLLSADIALPHKIFAHGFFTINGEKISKSLGNVIDPFELTKDYPFDAIRYYLLRDIPFGNDGDFSFERLKERYNADLANGLGNLVSRTLNMIEKFWPEFDGNVGQSREQAAVSAEIKSHLDNLAFDKALTRMWQIISSADELIEHTKPWELAKQGQTEQIHQVLTQLYQSLNLVNESLKPFLPETYQKLVELLQARPLKKPAEPLFARKA